MPILYEEIIYGRSERLAKARKLKIKLSLGEVLTLPIKTTLEAPNAKVGAIRIQNLKTGEWFNWDYKTRKFDKTPVIERGMNLYVGVWVVNTGPDGNVTCKVLGDNGQVIIPTTTKFCKNWGNNINIGQGFESGTRGMPSRDYTIKIEVKP